MLVKIHVKGLEVAENDLKGGGHFFILIGGLRERRYSIKGDGLFDV